ncbi:hypothetical protein A8990_11483 [Paenibacillus taihuensis]|uniref:Uncharacterized protein n=1 Tax=Paenibacillus taihuensis TaxID=1156355 RepID=A0A3D9RYL9_9BACL|nr:hypothetical protein [Paenibacillus taihuensis]REE84548.1 hypothetical protein A8990_11483 [Paenibacillus taihuensis]
MKITLEMSVGAYPFAKQVYLNQLTRTDGTLKINEATGMARGSAQAFVTIFLAMMSGSTYKRAFNNATNQFLLESIRKDFGDVYFQKALQATQGHIDYYSTLDRGNLTGLQRIVDQLRKLAL